MLDLFANYNKFKTRDGQEHLFVRLINNRHILAWKRGERNGGDQEAVCLGVRVEEVETGELRRLGLWDKLPAERQEAVKNQQAEARRQEREERSKRGRKRHPDYEGLPKNLICTGCGKRTVISPKTLLDKADEANITPKEYVKTKYQCRNCKPKKNPDAVYSLTCCECEKPKGTTPAAFAKQLEKSGLSKEEFIEQYVCKKCKKKVLTTAL